MTRADDKQRQYEQPADPPQPKWWEFAEWWAVENCGQVVLTLVGGTLCGLLGWWLWGVR